MSNYMQHMVISVEREQTKKIIEILITQYPINKCFLMYLKRLGFSKHNL